MVDQYIFSGSLPEEASTYVTREADGELYQGLKAGKFCYVLNSRQSGKSSLRVRTMRRLRESGVECSAIDLSAGGIQNVPPEQWYADLIDTLIDSFGLDVEFGDWWEANQLNSLVTRFRKFIEEILLAEVKENIVIFIDEIDSVLSLKFPTDDFFAFIRACYNQRVDNPEYSRLTFCLLGVASPSNLISDKKRTPFNIGKAISLKGFQLHEVEPLEKGLHERYSDSQAVMKEILHWTGGQPFLTQKLCQFMVEESEKENPRTVEQVVKSHIIDNWESQDEPEHLRTIRDRILRDEQRAGYLLELYKQVRLSEEQSQVIADDTLEQSELQLSGLVLRQQGKLRIYNQIYREIFDSNWIENQLKNLRPYSESFRFWVSSGGADDSRLLRGKALQEAEQWARDKNLNYQDKQYLAASKEKEIQEEIAAKEQEAALSRERKDREAAEGINKLLSEANKKAQRRISIGAFVLIIAVLGAAIVGLWSKRQADETKLEVEAVQKLNKLASELKTNSNFSSEVMTFDSNEALRLSALSFNIDNHELKKALIFAAMSQANQQLKKLKEADQEINKSQKFLSATNDNVKNSNQGLQIQVLFHEYQGRLLAQEKQTRKAIESYSTAFNIFKVHLTETDFTKNNQLLTSENIESVSLGLILLLANNNTELELRKQVETFLTKYLSTHPSPLYTKLEDNLSHQKWYEADKQTYQMILNFTGDQDKNFGLDLDKINSLPCEYLWYIDKLWVAKSNKRFGFSVQKEIWIKTGNRLGRIKRKDWTSKDKENSFRFTEAVGWKGEKTGGWNQNHTEWHAHPYWIDDKPRENKEGSLPTLEYDYQMYRYGNTWLSTLFSRVAACKL